MRICKYEYCDNYINNKVLQTKYCCDKHRSKQYRLNRIERYILESKKRIEEGRKNITEREIPTRITPQASRYQDLFIYSNLVMSKF